MDIDIVCFNGFSASKECGIHSLSQTDTTRSIANELLRHEYGCCAATLQLGDGSKAIYVTNPDRSLVSLVGSNKVFASAPLLSIFVSDIAVRLVNRKTNTRLTTKVPLSTDLSFSEVLVKQLGRGWKLQLGCPGGPTLWESDRVIECVQQLLLNFDTDSGYLELYIDYFPGSTQVNLSLATATLPLLTCTALQ